MVSTQASHVGEDFFAAVGRISWLRGNVRFAILSTIDQLLAMGLMDQGYGRVLAAEVEVEKLVDRLISVAEVRGVAAAPLAKLRRRAPEMRSALGLAGLVANGSWTNLGRDTFGLFEGEQSTPDGYRPCWKLVTVADLRHLADELVTVGDDLGSFKVAASLVRRMPWRLGLSPHGRHPATLPEPDATLDVLARIIVDAIARPDTNHPVFHGCFDWHSAVHGHWALLRIARTTGRHSEAATAVVASLRREGLAEEDAHLEREPAFEMPYGRAWFLRLAIEHDAWCRATDGDDPARLAPMAERVASSLLAHCEAHRAGPATREYASLAWALVQLHDYLSLTGDASRLHRVQRIVAEDFVASSATLPLALDRERPDFFSPFAGWAYLIARTTDAPTLGLFLARHRIADADLEPPPQLGPAHHLGLPWSRAWAFAALARAAPDPDDRARFAVARDAHVQAGLAVLAAHRGDYRAHDHWVPQFAVYALTE